MDNFWLGGFWLAEAERERGGWCIIRVLENENDSHLQILKKARHKPDTQMPFKSLKTGLEQVFIPCLYLDLRNHLNRPEVCIQLPIISQRIQ